MPTNKYFKCPFCDKRLSRPDLVNHIEKKHFDELPEGFTPLQATFHAVNRKDFSYRPPCRSCKQPTSWDEKKGRYNQLCGREVCHAAYVEKMRRDMGDKMGINRQTATAEGLEKMLANRRISGRYKFTTGEEVPYTGSYEKKALEFFDVVLGIKASDLMIPGPALKYELDGQTHIYIPDFYYIPYNLIIEIKDGGSKPNTNPAFKETRRKVLAKEKFIIEKTEYNYIRLTNNDFSQLLSIFADLKMRLVMDYDDKRAVHINEHMVGAIQAAIPPVSDNDVVVVNYMQNNVFAGSSKLAVANNPKFDKMYTQDDNTGKLISINKDYLNDKPYDTYVVHDCKNRVLEALYNNLNKEVSYDFLYETVFGHKKLSEDQILFEKNCEAYTDYFYQLHSMNEAIYNHIIKGEEYGH